MFRVIFNEFFLNFGYIKNVCNLQRKINEEYNDDTRNKFHKKLIFPITLKNESIEMISSYREERFDNYATGCVHFCINSRYIPGDRKVSFKKSRKSYFVYSIQNCFSALYETILNNEFS